MPRIRMHTTRNHNRANMKDNMMPWTTNDNDANAEKNDTRIASLLGTWVIELNTKVDVAGIKLKTHFIVHFECDSQLKGNACSLPDCSEMDNHVCMRNSSESGNICSRMDEAVVDWSDVVAFIYFGATVDVKIPKKHVDQSTGDWVGPFNIIMAQNTNIASDGNGTSRLLDSYVVKFVSSPTTPYLKMPPDCSLFSSEDFHNYLGPGGVNHTIRAQIDAGSDGWNFDPYKQFYKTCDNGDVQPVLPYVQFDFVNDTVLSEDGQQVSQVKIDAKMRYKIFVFPKKGDPMYDILPKLHAKGLPITGPYCYGNDPKRGYTIDFVYDNDQLHLNSAAQIHHACVEGLPCVPPAIKKCNCTSDAIPVVPSSGSNTINVGNTLFLTLGIVASVAVLLISLFGNWRQRKKIRFLTEQKTIPFQRLEDDVAEQEEEEQKLMEQPLLLNRELSVESLCSVPCDTTNTSK